MCPYANLAANFSVFSFAGVAVLPLCHVSLHVLVVFFCFPPGVPTAFACRRLLFLFSLDCLPFSDLSSEPFLFAERSFLVFFLVAKHSQPFFFDSQLLPHLVVFPRPVGGKVCVSQWRFETLSQLPVFLVLPRDFFFFSFDFRFFSSKAGVS